MMGIGTSASIVEDGFREMLNTAHHTWRVLEMGTKRQEIDRPTHHKMWAPDKEWILTDFEDGDDVDVVADAHTLVPFPDESFGFVIAIATWEHLQRPWIAAEQVSRILHKHGHALIVTHQTFPLHGYPSDFFRFSVEGLTTMFEDAGLVLISGGYQYPCRILPPLEVTRWNDTAPAFLNVAVHMHKP